MLCGVGNGAWSGWSLGSMNCERREGTSECGIGGGAPTPTLHDKAPRYLADLCIPVTSVEGRRQLRSATTGTFLLPRVPTSTGQRSFAVFGPATWKVYLPRYVPPNCRWAPSSACWRLSFSSTREPSSSTIVTEQRVRRRIQISGLNSTQLNPWMKVTTWIQGNVGGVSLGWRVRLGWHGMVWSEVGFWSFHPWFRHCPLLFLESLQLAECSGLVVTCPKLESHRGKFVCLSQNHCYVCTPLGTGCAPFCSA